MQHEYLIRKYFEPEGSYLETFMRLPGSEEDLTQDLDDLIIKSRVMDERDAAIIARRPHIAAVDPVVDVKQMGNAMQEFVGLSNREVPPPEVSAASSSVTLEQTIDLHKLRELHNKGIRGQGEVVAVLDTGISEAAAQGLSDRIIYKGSVVPNEDWKDTKSMHGTWCASAIAKGAPNAKLIIIKVLSTETGSGSSSGIIKAMNEAFSLGATIISMSLGGPGNRTDPMATAADSIFAKGVLVAAAAGNEQRGSTAMKAESSSPGCADGAICCGACDSDFAPMAFSNWGSVVDVMGIGGLIVETPYTVGSWSGTSMTTPNIAAILACLGSNGIPFDVVNSAFRKGCRDTSLAPHIEGNGMADATKQYQGIAAAPNPPAPPPAPAPPEKERRLYKKIGYFTDKGDFIPGSEGPKRAYLQPMRDGSVRFMPWDQHIVED